MAVFSVFGPLSVDYRRLSWMSLYLTLPNAFTRDILLQEFLRFENSAVRRSIKYNFTTAEVTDINLVGSSKRLHPLPRKVGDQFIQIVDHESDMADTARMRFRQFTIISKSREEEELDPPDFNGRDLGRT
jgi:hypothetical protein